MNKEITVFYETTPNPHSMKFNVTKFIANESVFFDNPTALGRSPLAQKLFGFPWTQAIHIGPNFVTVTKQDWVEWTVLAEPLSNLISEHLERGEDVLLDLVSAGGEENVFGENAKDIDDSEDVKLIKHILNTEIRPAVAMDGGDITFSRYEDGTLYLFLKGACAGCPSSTMTLKDGIETRLKQAIPTLKEVIGESY